jgi:hypothetical protein
MGMPREQPYEFLAGITAGADDGDFFELHERDVTGGGAGRKSDFPRIRFAKCHRALLSPPTDVGP